MTALQLEALAMQTAERVKAGHRVEDSFIEAKREWPRDYPKIARRLAAHANEMRGQPAVWIIGVDEDASAVLGAEKEEQGDWHAQVSKHFDQVAPALSLSRVAFHGDVPVVALLFDTTAAPYVVKKEHGTRGFEHDVPMRDGTRTRSARRSEIVRLLAPISPRVESEVLQARVYPRYSRPGSVASSLTAPPNAWGTPRLPAWAVEWDIYLTLLGNGPLTFPKHMAKGQLTVDSKAHPVDIVYTADDTNVNVNVSGGDLIVKGPGRARITGDVPKIARLTPHTSFLELELTLRALHNDKPLSFAAVARLNDGSFLKPGPQPQWIVEVEGG